LGTRWRRIWPDGTRANCASGRTALPERSGWPQWLETHDADDETSWKIRGLQRIEALGGEVLPIAADVCDRASMCEAIRQVHQRFGAIHGVIHAAGIVEPGLLQLKTQAEAERVLAPKVDGTLILESLAQDAPLDFLVLCSSINAIGGVAGSIDYTAANCFLDAFAASRFGGGKANVVSINWDAWRDVGMAFKRRPGSDAPVRKDREYDSMAIAPAEGAEAFERVLASGVPQAAVIPRDLHRLLEEIETRDPMDARGAAQDGAERMANQSLHPRPDLGTPFAASGDRVQSVMTEIWSGVLGIRDVGIDDNFFELGGHSLLAIALLGRARDKLGVTLGDCAQSLIRPQSGCCPSRWKRYVGRISNSGAGG